MKKVHLLHIGMLALSIAYFFQPGAVLGADSNPKLKKLLGCEIHLLDEQEQAALHDQIAEAEIELMRQQEAITQAKSEIQRKQNELDAAKSKNEHAFRGAKSDKTKSQKKNKSIAKKVTHALQGLKKINSKVTRKVRLTLGGTILAGATIAGSYNYEVKVSKNVPVGVYEELSIEHAKQVSSDLSALQEEVTTQNLSEAQFLNELENALKILKGKKFIDQTEWANEDIKSVRELYSQATKTVEKYAQSQDYDIEQFSKLLDKTDLFFHNIAVLFETDLGFIPDKQDIFAPSLFRWNVLNDYLKSYHPSFLQWTEGKSHLDIDLEKVFIRAHKTLMNAVSEKNIYGSATYLTLLKFRSAERTRQKNFNFDSALSQTLDDLALYERYFEPDFEYQAKGSTTSESVLRYIVQKQLALEGKGPHLSLFEAQSTFELIDTVLARNLSTDANLIVGLLKYNIYQAQPALEGYLLRNTDKFSQAQAAAIIAAAGSDPAEKIRLHNLFLEAKNKRS